LSQASQTSRFKISNGLPGDSDAPIPSSSPAGFGVVDRQQKARG
jgi:hypothetical protein